jgi:succinate dehydrogenase / fumarate reductase membrane anchor subunit
MSPDKSGTTHFWQQRVTAIANVPMVIFLLVLSFVSILWHMRLGMEMVIEDYVQDARALHASLLANNIFTATVGLAALYAILKIFFGA